MVREDRSEAGVSEVSEFHASSDLIPRVGPRARVLLLGVRMCRGDNIDAAHDWNARVPVGFGFFLAGRASPCDFKHKEAPRVSLAAFVRQSSLN